MTSSPAQPGTRASSPPEGRALVEAVIASTIGTTIEWYDFFLYVTAAATVFPQLFFPSYDPYMGQILAFGTSTVGFIARSLGGLIFGYLGDRIGRKSTLVATLLLMGVSTLLIGFLPTYHQIGIMAPIILTLLRVVQGLGVGGEWGGAVLLALEFGHRGKRGYYASWPQAGVPLGLITSTGTLAFFEAILSPADFLAWGWRIPFFASGLLIGVGFLIRLRVMETPLFTELREKKQLAESPIFDVIRHHWREILLAAGARISENSVFYLFSSYVIAYGEQVHRISSQLLMLAVCLAAAVEFLAIPIYGMFSDNWSRKGMYVLGNLTLIAFAWPYYALLGSGQTAAIVLAVVLSLATGHAMLYSVQASLIPELFGTRLRYTGASIAYQLAAPVAGGLAPVIAATLVKNYPGESWPLALYITLISLISLGCVLGLAETSRRDLSQHE